MLAKIEAKIFEHYKLKRNVVSAANAEAGTAGSATPKAETPSNGAKPAAAMSAAAQQKARTVRAN
jgi:hypothetical protein